MNILVLIIVSIILVIIVSVIWEFSSFCRYVGYRGIFDFVDQTDGDNDYLEEGLSKKAHLLTFQGLRAVKEVEEEHCMFQELESLKHVISVTKKAIECDEEEITLHKIESKTLFKVTGESGRKLREFLVEWNKFGHMADIFKIIIGDFGEKEE